ncbi:MAG: recombinase family protein [Clostridiales bacterium]|nr:recombinase family protein [Clostridiales bacterium]
MERVVYYARVSTDEEQQASALVTQCMENEEFIESINEWKCVDKYIDEGKSGTTTEGRSAFTRMVRDMENDHFDIILIKQIDRGWRNLGDWKIFEQRLIASGKKLFVRLKNDFFDIEDDGSYISTTMDNMFSEWYSRNLSKKLNVAHKTRMKKGTIVTNGKMWGYDQINADLVINEEEAKIVKLIFNLYIQGKGFRTISNELNDIGIKSKTGTQFALTTLKRMIRNEKYKGTLICGKTHRNFFTKKIESVPEEDWIIHENRIPPIISEEVWNEANEILMSKRRKYNPEKVAGYFQGTYPLSSKIKCALCGQTYYHNSYGKKGKKTHMWQCATYGIYGRSEKGCKNSTLRADDVEVIIKEIIFNMWDDKDNQVKDVIRTLEKIIEESSNQEEIESVKKSINKLESNKLKVFDLYIEEYITKDEFKKKNDDISIKLDNQIIQRDKLINEDVYMNDKTKRMESITDFFNQDMKDISSVSNTMIEDMIESIVVYPDRKMDVTLNGRKSLSVSATRSSRHPGGSGCSTIS